MEKIITNLAKLVDLKSLLTILIAVTLSVIIFTQLEIKDEGIKTLFISIASSVFTSYFQKKDTKKTEE
jgi:Na+/H+ antiporter NhaC